MQKPRFSIIIPTFNSANYIYSCLESVTQQTCKDYEIVILDDGSTDNTKEIIDIFSIKYNNIRYYYQNNKGVSVTTNNLVKLANGEYIINVDSDDRIELTLIEKLNNVVNIHHFDIIQFYNDYTFNNKLTKDMIDDGEIYIIGQNKTRDYLFHQSKPYCSHTGKAIKKELFLQGSFFGPGYAADTVFIHTILPLAQSYADINYIGYHVFYRSYSESCGIIFDDKLRNITLDRIVFLLDFSYNPVFFKGGFDKKALLYLFKLYAKVYFSYKYIKYLDMKDPTIKRIYHISKLIKYHIHDYKSIDGHNKYIPPIIACPLFGRLFSRRKRI